MANRITASCPSISAARRAAVRELDRMGLLTLADEVLEGGGTELTAPPKGTPVLFELEWLLEHTVPVAGELGAALESWSNVLRALGVGPAARESMLERAGDRWAAAQRPARTVR